MSALQQPLLGCASVDDRFLPPPLWLSTLACRERCFATGSPPRDGASPPLAAKFSERSTPPALATNDSILVEGSKYVTEHI